MRREKGLDGGSNKFCCQKRNANDFCFISYENQSQLENFNEPFFFFLRTSCSVKLAAFTNSCATSAHYKAPTTRDLHATQPLNLTQTQANPFVKQHIKASVCILFFLLVDPRIINSKGSLLARMKIDVHNIKVCDVQCVYKMQESGER